MPAFTDVRVRAFVEHIMGLPVSVHVRAVDPSRPDIAAGVAEAFDVLRRADAVFSTWRSDSEVMRRRRGDSSVTDSDEVIREVMNLCAVAGEATQGLFVTDLDGPDGTRGWDPTGVVKGWAVDAAADLLRSIPRITFSINAGGDIVCGVGIDADDLVRPWNIGVENPVDRSGISMVIPVTDGALATSSAAARGAHIIDPRTGTAVAHTYSATVTGPCLTWADVWATACFIEPGALGRANGWSDYRVWMSNWPA
ncbi:FAD:protein FMN transferase [Actinomycetes bacterium M1A6_2h]